MLIKASRITNLTDARYFAAKEVDFLGFNLEEGTEGYLDPMYVKAIREWVEGPKIVGEFSRSPAAYVREAAAFFGLDAVQMEVKSINEAKQNIAALNGAPGHLYWSLAREKTPPVVDHFFQSASETGAELIVLDFTGSGLSWKGLLSGHYWEYCCRRFPTLLQIDAPPEVYPQIFESLRPAGFCFVGGEEEQVGVKSFDEIEAIFEALRR